MNMTTLDGGDCVAQSQRYLHGRVCLSVTLGCIQFIHYNLHPGDNLVYANHLTTENPPVLLCKKYALELPRKRNRCL